MIIYPVIFIKSGNCVRSAKVSFYDNEVVTHFPVKMANSFQNSGAEWLHVIDLDGVREGHAVNDDIIENIIHSVSIPVQVGGGIRSIKEIDNKLKLGAKKVVIGTKAVQSPGFVKEAVNLFGADKIVISIDVKQGCVVTDGYEKVSTYNPIMFAGIISEMGVNTIIYTDVEENGPKGSMVMDTVSSIRKLTGANVIVSTGIRSVSDLEKVHAAKADGVLLSKVLYDKKIELLSIIEKFR